MAQLPHLVVGDSPTDITDGLDAGCYVAQVRPAYGEQGVLIATATAAPADVDDYFLFSGGAFFSFRVGPSEMPTWARSSVTGVAYTLALTKSA